MNIEKLKDIQLKPRHDLVALQWLPSKQTKAGFYVPENYYDFGLKLGKLYLCKVLAIGPEVTQLKIGDQILINEYGILSFPGTWKETQVYFSEEKNCKAKVTGIDKFIPFAPSESRAKALDKSL